MMPFDAATLEKLKTHSKARDRTAYYETLTAAGDAYGPLALGVVKQSTMSGRVARCYAMAVAAWRGRPSLVSPAY